MVAALDHLLLTGDSAQDQRFYITLLLSRRFWVVGALALVLPFSFYRTLDELKKASALALVFVFMLVGTILAYAGGGADPCAGSEDGGSSCRGEIHLYTDVPSTLSKLPIFIFAFTCHQNVFPIVNEIELPSQRRLNLVICFAIGIALVVFSAVAGAGYHTFGSLVRGDVLLNYPENRGVTFLRVCIAFMLALHYPLQLDPSRRCITSLTKVVASWYQNQGGAHETKGGSNIEMEQDESSRRSSDGEYVEMSSNDVDVAKERPVNEDDRLFYAITLSFLSLSFILAMIVEDLGLVLSLVGATGSTLVSFVLPGLIYLKVHERMDASKMMAYLQLGMGIAIMPLALYFTITKQGSH